MQTCSNVCGVVALICAVVAALDSSLFATITGSRFGLHVYLHDPTKYERYLRRVLISWFMTGDLNVSLLQVNMNLTERPTASFSSVGDHVYAAPPTKPQKRKSSDTVSQTTSKQANSSINSQQTHTKKTPLNASVKARHQI